MNKGILLTLTFATVAFCVAGNSDNFVPNWREEQGVYEVYGNTLDKFLELHPFTLVFIQGSGEQSNNALAILQKLHEKFTSKNIHITIAKMRKGDGPRWIHEWNVKRLPYFRFCIGNGVSVTTRAFPTVDSIFNWATNIYKNQLRVGEVKTAADKQEFNNTENAFYLRFNPKKEDYFEMLTKFQMLDPNMRVFYATNPTHDVFDNLKPEDVVIGFKRSFEEPIKYLSSPDRLNSDNIMRFFYTYREPTVVELDEELLNKIVTERIRTAFYFKDKENSKVLEAFKYIAFEQKDNYLFAIVPDDEELIRKLEKEVNTADEADVIRIVEFDGEAFRVFDVEGETLQDIAASFEKFSGHSLEEQHQTNSNVEKNLRVREKKQPPVEEDQKDSIQSVDSDL